MTWVLASVAIVVLGLTAVVASGRWGQMPEVVDDRPLPRFAEGWLDAEQVRSARFDVVLRGYSPRQVDALLARLADQLDEGPSPDSGEIHEPSFPASSDSQAPGPPTA